MGLFKKEILMGLFKREILVRSLKRRREMVDYDDDDQEEEMVDHDDDDQEEEMVDYDDDDQEEEMVDYHDDDQEEEMVDYHDDDQEEEMVDYDDDDQEEEMVDYDDDDSALTRIIQPPCSISQYRSFDLENGLSVMLVSSRFAQQPAAAMSVRCGSFADPSNMGGLAHLLEHMLFLGSTKYPGVNEFQDFIHRHGGSTYAKTELDHSLFSLRVDEYLQFEEALKMFAEMLTNPTMDFDLLKRELLTIDSEFKLKKYKDSSRYDQLLCHTSSEAHPFHRFTWGNSVSFSQCEPQDIHAGVRKLFNEYYMASNMKLVVFSSTALYELEELVRRCFGNLKQGSSPKSVPTIFSPTKDIWGTSTCYTLESLEGAQCIRMSWVLPPTQHESSKPERLIVFLLAQENKGSLSSCLKSKGWVTSFTASLSNDISSFESDDTWSYSSTSVGQIFVIESDLTNTGWEKKYELVTYVFQYLNLLRVESPSQSLIDEYANLLEMKYYGLEYDLSDPLCFVGGLAANMLKGPTTHALSMDFKYSFGEQGEMEDMILKYFTQENMRLDFFSKPFNDNVYETEPYFKAKYKVEEIPAHYISTWQNKDIERDSSLCLPALNEFMPSRFNDEVINASMDDEDDEDDEDDGDDGDDEDDEDDGFKICVDEVSANGDDEDDEDDGFKICVDEVSANEDDGFSANEDDGFSANEDDEDDGFSANEDDEDDGFKICVEEVSAKLFHKANSGLLSSALFKLHANVEPGIKAHTKTKIIIEMIKEDLTAILMRGEDAYIKASLSFKDNNILELKFDGFNERFKDFITEIWKRIQSFIPKEECFQIIMEKMQREFTSRDLAEQSEELLSNNLIEDNTTLEEKLNVLKNITFEEVKHLSFPSKIGIVGVCSGKLSSEESIEILRVFGASGNFIIPNVPKKRVLAPGFPLQINAKPETASETNSLARVYFQMSCKEEEIGRETAFLAIIKAAIETYLYHELRIKERLGYEFGSSIHLDSGTKGFSVYVVSSSHQPKALVDHIYNFVGSIGKFLERVDASCFGSYKVMARNFLPRDEGGQEVCGFADLLEMEKEDVIVICEDIFTRTSCCSIEVCIATGGQ